MEAAAENKMGTMPISKLLLSMAIPMMIAMLFQALYNIVDSIFVARLGEEALAAVTLAFPLQMIMLHIGVGTGVGVNALLSRSLGERNFSRVNKTAMNGLFLAGISALVFMAIGFLGVNAYFGSQTSNPQILKYGNDYLFWVCVFAPTLFGQVMFERLLMSTGKTQYQMVSQIAGALTNIVLDPIMIFGLFGFPRLEVVGAAVATVIGEGVAMSVALYFNLAKNHEIDFSFKGFRPDWQIIRRIYRVGVPSILMASLGSVMVYGLNRILIGFTATAVAVLGVYFRLQSFIFMPVFGLNNAMVPIVAFNFGARNKVRIIHTVELSLIYALGIMLLGMLAFHIFPDKLLGLFNAGAEMLRIGVPALQVISLHFIFAAVCIVMISVFQALGRGIESLILAFARQILVLLPAAWLLSLTGDVRMIWWSFPIAEGVAVLFALGFFRRAYVRKIKPLSCS
ncbi:putative efflux protein MATE family [Candidatus Termititenax dinenymphae]|uniref:Probable multidrug resistance protein NorM n=1 Tax=Candidatus Termititenax dinenymphae TaxID=2218523 RepID=A0A388TME4_9BACT|nr:putative efflux protein MATE family [Candidatus Termititenax dinenymphae]